MNAQWIRVTRANPCHVCGRSDWDTYSPELGLACCMRVASNRPAKNGGWLHPIDGAIPKIQHKVEPFHPSPTIDAESLMTRWLAHTSSEDYDALAIDLGVATDALISLRAAWAAEHGAWAFPMTSGAGETVGIRLRYSSGRKLSVKGGREGIFMPRGPHKRTVWIVEGPSDAAALLSMGFYAIGRPSCSGGGAALASTVARLCITMAVVLADNDEDHVNAGRRWNPGLDGAKRLAQEIGIPCALVVLPCKDAREALAIGMTSETLDAIVKSVVWHQPTKKTQAS